MQKQDWVEEFKFLMRETRIGSPLFNSLYTRYCRPNGTHLGEIEFSGSGIFVSMLACDFIEKKQRESQEKTQISSEELMLAIEANLPRKTRDKPSTGLFTRFMAAIGVVVCLTVLALGIVGIAVVKRDKNIEAIKVQEELEREINRHGFECGELGIPDTACPHEPGNARQIWLNGWIDGVKSYRGKSTK